MGSDQDKFYNNYFILKPDEGGILDLFHLLCSRNIEKNKFLECPEGTEIAGLKRRWLIFLSIVVQIFLLYLAKPMSWIGLMFETCLNLLSNNNGNFVMLLLNFLQGKLVIPDKKSATFTSIVGNVDKRVELDKNIGHGDNKYYAALSIMAAKLAYENEAFIQTIVRDHWKMEFLGFFNFWNDYQDRYSTQAFMLQDKRADPELIIVAFRGTEPFNADEWRTDVDISWYELPGVGNVHGGFMKALGLQKGLGWPKELEPGRSNNPFAYYTIREKLRDMLGKNSEAKFMLTGHSLGGALAILFPMVLALHGEEWMLKRLEGVYTFGQPRVGDKKLGEFMMENLKVNGVSYFRYVYSNDIVPRLPSDDSTLLFKHFGTCPYYNSCYQGKIVLEEPNKNYFSVTTVIPKFLNAVWELLRSFIIPYIKGPEYREGWFLRLIRVIGLITPGISAHAPQDYVNSTRLGSSIQTLERQDPIHPDHKID